MVVNNTKYEGCTPEAFKEYETFNSWLNLTKLKAKFFIMKREVHKQISEIRTPSLS